MKTYQQFLEMNAGYVQGGNDYAKAAAKPAPDAVTLDLRIKEALKLIEKYREQLVQIRTSASGSLYAYLTNTLRGERDAHLS